jgi:hypothetical protein
VVGIRVEEHTVSFTAHLSDDAVYLAARSRAHRRPSWLLRRRVHRLRTAGPLSKTEALELTAMLRELWNRRQYLRR